MAVKDRIIPGNSCFLDKETGLKDTMLDIIYAAIMHSGMFTAISFFKSDPTNNLDVLVLMKANESTMLFREGSCVLLRVKDDEPSMFRDLSNLIMIGKDDRAIASHICHSYGWNFRNLPGARLLEKDLVRMATNDEVLLDLIRKSFISIYSFYEQGGVL